jgi:hypothetical protein
MRSLSVEGAGYRNRRRTSDPLDDYAIRVRSEGLEVVGIRGQQGPVWLGERHDERVYGGPSASEPAQKRRSASKRLRHGFCDVTSLE